jgi:tRNA dimethylallyltransferase
LDAARDPWAEAADAVRLQWTRLDAPAERRPWIVVVGPTASGKTELAIALAHRFDGEVISADSVQIYREFQLGTGKPSEEERAAARHHLVDAVDPLDPVDAARYGQMATTAAAEIAARGKTVIVCGGTFLWVRALLFGLAGAPPGSDALRASYRARFEAEGPMALHAALAQVDAPLAARLHPNDFVRVSRGLEVYELTGRPLSSWQEAHGFRTTRTPVVWVGVHRTGAALDARIRERVRHWLAAGWVDEVRALRARGYGSARAMSSVGFRQINERIDSSSDGSDRPPTLEDEIVQATRTFVRRQRTWLRDLEVSWVEPPKAKGDSP